MRGQKVPKTFNSQQWYQDNRDRELAKRREKMADPEYKAAVRARERAKYAERKNDPEYKARKLAESKNNYSKKKADRPWQLMCNRARSRATRDGLPFDIDAAYLQSIWPADDSCPIFKTKFISNDISYCASLDKIIPALGYVRGNVRIICNKANLMKSNSTLEEMRMLVSFYESIH